MKAGRRTNCSHCLPIITIANLTILLRTIGEIPESEVRSQKSAPGAVETGRTAQAGCLRTARKMRALQLRALQLRALPLRALRQISNRGGENACTTALFPTRRYQQKQFHQNLIGSARLEALPTPKPQNPIRSNLSSVPTRQSTMVASRTTAGCRNCRNPSRN